MPAAPVTAALMAVGRAGERGNCAFCGRSPAQHLADCVVRDALRFPGDIERAAAVLEASAAGPERRCLLCATPLGIRHLLDCEVGKGLFVIDCLREDSRAA